MAGVRDRHIVIYAKPRRILNIDNSTFIVDNKSVNMSVAGGKLWTDFLSTQKAKVKKVR